MRVATFNILHGRCPEDDEVHVDRFAGAVAALDADVLALQEVDRNQVRSGNADLTAVAAEAMNARHHRFVAALSGSPGSTWLAATGHEQPDDAAYGIALLSRYPLEAWQVIRLPPVPTRVPMRFGGRLRPTWVRDEPRVAVAADVATPLGDLTAAPAAAAGAGGGPAPSPAAADRRPQHGPGDGRPGQRPAAARHAPDLPGGRAAGAARPPVGRRRPRRRRV
jgi:hypothetical protein